MAVWGLPFLIGGLSVFNKFKPSAVKQESVEDLAIAPPVLNIPFEATNTATLQISGYSTPNSEVEIYFDDEVKEKVETNSGGNFNTGPLELSLGTNNIYGKTINEKGIKSLPSKTIKLIFNNEKPKLEISEPQDNAQIKGGDKKIRVSGNTDPNNTISINGSNTIVSSEGKFSAEVNINEGDNVIQISTTNQVGNSNQIERKINYTP